MVSAEGAAPSLAVSKAAVLLLYDAEILGLGEVIGTSSLAYKARALPLS